MTGPVGAAWVLDGSTESVERLGQLVTAAHRRVEALLIDALGHDDQQMAPSRPTRLPGWTLGHLLAHLWQNAASHIRVLNGVRRGEVLGQYEGGTAGRAAAIEAESGTPVPDLVANLHHVDRQLESVWAELTPQHWAAPTQMRAGQRPAHVCLWARWREVELHAVDLDLGYGTDRWSDEFAVAGLAVNTGGGELRSVAERLAPATSIELSDGARSWRSDPGAAVTHRGQGPASSLLAWVVGRAPSEPIVWDREPDIEPWP